MKKIVIFGSSGLGRSVYFSLDRLKYEVVAFIDNASQLTLDMVKNGCIDNELKDLPFAKGMILDNAYRGGSICLKS